MTDEPLLPCPGPWASGPLEILDHASHLINDGTDSGRRIGIILVDNAVELTMSVYLGLPTRANGLHLTRREVEDMTFNFTKLLDGLEQHVSAALDGIDTSEVEWFHRLRNQLYHEGNGLTVEATKAQGYLAVARTLFERLLGEPDAASGLETTGPPVEDFIELWATLHSTAVMGGDQKNVHNRLMAILAEDIGRHLRYDRLQTLRNEIVHGSRVPTEKEVADLRSLVHDLKEVASTRQRGPRSRG